MSKVIVKPRANWHGGSTLVKNNCLAIFLKSAFPTHVKSLVWKLVEVEPDMDKLCCVLLRQHGRISVFIRVAPTTQDVLKPSFIT